MIELEKVKVSQEPTPGRAVIERSTLKPEPTMKELEEDRARKYELALQTQKEKEKDQLTYTYMTGDPSEPPPEWVATRDKGIFNCLKQHLNNNLAEGDLNRLYYDRQKIREVGEDSADIDRKLIVGEEALALGQARAKEMSSLTGGILNTFSDAFVGIGRRAGTALDWGQDKDYTRFAAGAQLRAHPDYSTLESIIHGAIEKGGEDALWLMPVTRLGRIGKLIEKQPLTRRLVRGLIEGFKWETVLAGPEILHKAIDEALDADENYYEGSPLELEATVRRDSYKDILMDNLMIAAVGGVLGTLGREPIKIAEKLRVAGPEAAAIRAVAGKTPLETRKILAKIYKDRVPSIELAKIIDKELPVVKPLAILKEPSKIRKMGQTVKAWYPTYSAYVEKRFGPTGWKVLYTDIHRATTHAEKRIEREVVKVFKDYSSGWFREMVKLPMRVGKKTVILKMTRGQKLDILMQSRLNRAGTFSFEKQVFKVRDIGKSPSKEELGFISRVGELFEYQGKRLANKRAIEGKSFELVKRYYPIRREGYAMTESWLSTAKGWKHEGWLKKREVSNLPVVVRSIDNVVKSSIRKTNQYLFLKIPTQRGLNVVTQMKKLNSAERAMLKDQLLFNYGSRLPETAIEKGLRKLMRNLTVGILGLNPFVALKQVCSGPLALVYVKPRYWTRGFLDYFSHPKEVKKFFTKHSFWTSKRLTVGMNKEMQDLAQHSDELISKISKVTMWPIKKMDEGAVMGIMNGAYKQAFDEIMTGHLSPQVKKVLGEINKSQTVTQQAIRFAEAVVAKTQPMFDVLNRSRLANSGVIGRSCTMFSSATNQMGSLIYRTSKKGDWATCSRAVSFIMINMAGVMGVDYLRDKLYQRDHPRTWKSVGGELLASPANLVYFARDVAGWIKYYQYGSHPDNPLVGWSNDMLDGFYQIYKTMAEGESLTEWQVKKLLQTTLHAIGIPTVGADGVMELLGTETRLQKAGGTIKKVAEEIVEEGLEQVGTQKKEKEEYTPWKKK